MVKQSTVIAKNKNEMSLKTFGNSLSVFLLWVCNTHKPLQHYMFQGSQISHDVQISIKSVTCTNVIKKNFPEKTNFPGSPISREII